MELGRDHRLCYVGASALADHLGFQRSSVQVLDIPELTQTKEVGQRVELICDVGDLRVSFEHTEIESYPEQIRDGHHLARFTNLVSESLDEPLATGTFTLSFHTEAVLGVTGKAAEEAAIRLATWISGAARDLAKDAENHDTGTARQSNDDSPVPVVLWYRTGTTPKQLQFSRWVPPELEAKRQERIGKAFAAKLPKLEATRNFDCHPCLILEDRDISLANTGAIRDGSRGALEQFAETQPEWILLVESVPEPSLWVILFSSGEWPDLTADAYVEIEIPDKVEIDLP